MKTVRKLLPVLFGLLLFVLLGGCIGSEKREIRQAVCQELELLKTPDPDAIVKYISYVDLFPGETKDLELSSDIQEIFTLFFQDFNYKLLDIHIAGKRKSATATVRLKTLDARTLARDYAAAVLQKKIMLASDQSSQKTKENNISIQNRCAILSNLLKTTTYETVQTDCSVNLTKSDKTGVWAIKRSTSLENDLTGGLLTYLSDNSILSPQKTLAVYFDTLKSMDGAQMYRILGMEPLLKAEDAEKAYIASALAEQVHRTFNYEVLDETRSGYQATVNVRITTFDSNAILSRYQRELDAYMETPDAVIDGSELRYEKSYNLLLRCIRENTATATAEAAFSLINDGISWRLQDDSHVLGNAIFGDLGNPVTEEDEDSEDLS